MGSGGPRLSHSKAGGYAAFHAAVPGQSGVQTLQEPGMETIISGQTFLFSKLPPKTFAFTFLKINVTLDPWLKSIINPG